MTRRNLMAVATRSLAVAGGQEFFADWLRAAEQARHTHSAAPPEPDRWSNYRPKFFSPAEFAMLEAFTEILIPTDDTPGAREAHVTHYIDFVVSAASEYAPEMQQDWRTAVAWLAGQRFGQLTSQEKLALVEQMAAPERDRSKKHDGFATYRLIKQMTVFAFYTSRAGLVQNLEYQGLAYLTGFPACNHAEHRRV
jgi:Gluconate 2-dehydrogenase subunit 3